MTLTTGLTLHAQIDTIPSDPVETMELIAPDSMVWVYPVFRMAGVHYDLVSRQSMRTESDGDRIGAADRVGSMRGRAFFAMPFLIKPKWVFSASAVYTWQHLALGAITLPSTGEEMIDDRRVKMDDIVFTPSATYRDSLFGKPFSVTGALSLMSNDFTSVKKAVATATGYMTLRATSSTRIGVGLTLLSERSVLSPVIPTMTYWHRFSNGRELSLLLPVSAELREQIKGRGWLAARAEINGSRYFFEVDRPQFDGTTEHVQTEIRTGLKFDYPITPTLLVGAFGGFQTPLTGKLRELGASNKDVLVDTKWGMTGFLNLSLSYAPGMRRKIPSK